MAVKTFRPSVLLVTLLLLTGCHMPTATPEPIFPALDTGHQFEPFSMAMFSDDFNDNDLTIPLPPWAAGSYAKGYHDLVCSPGDCWLRFYGPDFDQVHDSGLQHYLGEAYTGIRPDYISFDVFSFSINDTDAKVGYFVLMGRPDPSAGGSYQGGIEFYLLGQQVIANGSAYTVPVSLESNWVQVEFKNFSWDSIPPRFDLYVEGSLAAGCLSLLNPLQSFEVLKVYNFDDGYVGFDNIFMGTGIGEDLARAPDCGPPPPPPPPAPTASASATATATATASPTLPAPVVVEPTATFTTVPVSVEPTATFTSVPVTCAGLNQVQCNSYPLQCRWAPILTQTGNDGRCVNR